MRFSIKTNKFYSPLFLCFFFFFFKKQTHTYRKGKRGSNTKPHYKLPSKAMVMLRDDRINYTTYNMLFYAHKIFLWYKG